MLGKILAVVLLLTLNITTVYSMGDPAATYCLQLGGKSEIARYKNGDEFATCRFPNGNIYEEWTLFRMFNAKRDNLTSSAH